MPKSTIGIRYREKHSMKCRRSSRIARLKTWSIIAFKDRIVISTDHEIWDILENGSDK